MIELSGKLPEWRLVSLLDHPVGRCRNTGGLIVVGADLVPPLTRTLANVEEATLSIIRADACPEHAGFGPSSLNSLFVGLNKASPR